MNGDATGKLPGKVSNASDPAHKLDAVVKAKMVKRFGFQ